MTSILTTIPPNAIITPTEVRIPRTNSKAEPIICKFIDIKSIEIPDKDKKRLDILISYYKKKVPKSGSLLGLQEGTK